MHTCDHGPVVQTGGQLCVLQACLLPGVGWVQRESARSSTLVWLVLWTHWTCRVCSPPPQLWLQTPHSPTDQLAQHSINPLSQQAVSKSLIQIILWEFTLTCLLNNNSKCRSLPVLCLLSVYTSFGDSWKTKYMWKFQIALNSS